jgi:vacuolar protein sorting-associated protein 26
MLKGKSKVDHLGIRVELIGVIENLFDKNQTTTFINLGQELEPPGILTDSCEYTFSFNRVEKKFESYNGIIVRLRYYVNVVINRNYNRITKEEEFIVYNPIEEPSYPDKPIKMEVGIEDCLHIEFEFSRAVYSLKDCILGKVFFNLVRIKIKHMEVALIRREAAGFLPAASVGARPRPPAATPSLGSLPPYLRPSNPHTPTHWHYRGGTLCWHGYG